jgi:Fur family ferric uptake transcriptional regulator
VSVSHESSSDLSTATSQRRTTKQRTAVIGALESTSEFRSAQQIHEALSTAGANVGLTTVYRALQTLAADGDIDVIISDDGQAQYRLCSNGHHHHLVCRKCGTTVEVAGPTVERWAQKIADDHSFTQTEHTIEITGFCPACAP